MSRDGEIKRGLYDHTLAGDAVGVRALVEEGLALGIPPEAMLFEALIPSLQEVGRRFECGEYFVPEMLISAKAMHVALGILRPLMAQSDVKPVATVVMATVRGDLHDIGKNLCSTMLEGSGFTVVDLGTNVPAEKVVAAVKEHRASLLGLSAFLTTTLPMFKANIEALVKEGLRDGVKVMVGGAPVTQEYADKVGADGYAADASATVRLARRLSAELERAAPGSDGQPPEPLGVARVTPRFLDRAGEARGPEPGSRDTRA
jgi:5-methyltetrahydrofolate--homocysteine methyltransferase